jgi:V/A-type H+-transporting ATPase subunit K
VGSTIGAGIALYGVAIGGSALLAENPKAFTQVLILGGLAEGVAVYGLLVAFLIMGG